MKSYKYVVLAAVLFLGGVAALCSSRGQQVDYDWDKVDEAELNRRQPPDRVMDALGVKPGMMVGEVGAGGGRYAVKMAERVGPIGRVFANDIAKSAVDYLKNRCRENNISNIEVILGQETDPLFPPGILDLVYMTFTYRHLSKPVPILKNIKPALKKSGILAILESKPSGDGSAVKRMIANAEEAGYTLVRTETFLPLDNIWIFKPADF